MRTVLYLVLKNSIESLQSPSEKHVMPLLRAMDDNRPVIPKDWVNLVRTQTNVSKNSKRKAADEIRGIRNTQQKTEVWRHNTCVLLL